MRSHSRRIGEVVAVSGTYRTNCDECGVPLFGTEGHEFGHGSYCVDCSLEYRTVDAETDRSGDGDQS